MCIKYFGLLITRDILALALQDSGLRPCTYGDGGAENAGLEKAGLELNGPNQQTPIQCRWLCTL